MAWRFRAVQIILGVLLLGTATLKLYGLGVSAVPRTGWFAQSWVQLAAAEGELVLGVWLLAGSYPRGAWLATLLTFTAFAAVSGYLGWVGIASCGCFGTIHASPWWAFVVDVAIIVALLVARPGITRTGNSEYPAAAFKLIASSGLIVALVASVAISIYGTPQAALARLRGEPIAIAPAILDMGSGQGGSVLCSRVELTNWSPQPVRVFGGTSDCSCITNSDLPITIPPGESRWVTVELHVPRSVPGKLTRRAELFTDSEHQPRAHLLVSGEVE